MATFQKRTNGVIATIRRKGYPTQSKTHRNLTLAKQWAQRIEDEMRLGLFENKPEVSLGDVFDWYRDNIVPLKKTTKYCTPSALVGQFKVIV